MRRAASLPLLAAGFGALVVSVAGIVRAQERAPNAPASAPTSAPASAPATIRPHAYTLEECLALADRNFPNLWAARERLAFTHAQLEEARWLPWFQGWSASSAFGVLPTLAGTAIYPQSNLYTKNISSLTDLTPFFQFAVAGSLPIYTFGKIESGLHAAEANVRWSEWDMEKARQQTRIDVRRAFFGLELARDVKDVASEALDRLDKAVQGIKDKIARGDANVSEVDRLRLEAYKQEVTAQALQVPKGESYALAGLRFLTGVETNFDIVDEPLKRPDRPLVSVAQYLEAARVLRPDVNMARAGVGARGALLDLARAKLFPDLALNLGADYFSAPSAVQQQNLYASDSFNHFYYYFALGMRWSLDLLPQAARAKQAESQLAESRSIERLALAGAMLEVEKAYADAVEAKGREETLDKSEHLAKQWISIVADHIDLGTSDERALLEPLRAYGNARVQHLYALMDYNIALSSLAQVSGWDSAAPTGS